MEESRDRPVLPDHLNDLVRDRLIVASQEGGSPGLKIVHIAVAVHIVKVGAFRLVNGKREGVVEGQVVLDTAWDILSGL